MAADAMPYHSHRRFDCKMSRAPDLSDSTSESVRHPGVALWIHGSPAHRGMRTVVASRVRDARVTDVGPITALLEGHGFRGSEIAQVADLLRTLVYQPNATVLVAQEGRETIGVVVLALRPSISEGGLVGTIDLLAVDRDRGGVLAARELLDEAMRSARNKGCVLVEAADLQDPPAPERWAAHGFEPSTHRPVWTSRLQPLPYADPANAPRRRPI